MPMRDTDPSFRATADSIAMPDRPRNPWLAQQYAADVHRRAMALGARPTNTSLGMQRAEQANQARLAIALKYGVPEQVMGEEMAERGMIPGQGGAPSEAPAQAEAQPAPGQINDSWVQNLIQRMLASRYGVVR